MQQLVGDAGFYVDMAKIQVVSADHGIGGFLACGSVITNAMPGH